MNQEERNLKFRINEKIYSSIVIEDIPGNSYWGTNELGIIKDGEMFHVFSGNDCHIGCCQLYLGFLTTEEIENFRKNGVNVPSTVYHLNNGTMVYEEKYS